METGVFEQLADSYTLIKKIQSAEEIIWFNTFSSKSTSDLIQSDIIHDAQQRLDRFKPFFMRAFPETAVNNGLIESPLVSVNQMAVFYRKTCHSSGNFFAKLDSHLPVSGSIKARGGIYEILKHAEQLAVEHHMLSYNDDYSILLDKKFKDFFSQYSISVGSTGNLGLSIGIISAVLGFQVTVHMSQDARQWKKDMLRSKGVQVIEYNDDYSKAVKEGRKQAGDTCHFVDDENSKDLFAGYAVASLRLEKQLLGMNIEVSKEKPLFVYLPCGVGGGPGGIAYGLHQIYGNNVHCFFAEPTHSPCMTLGLMTGLHDKISVQDIGLDNKTCADGLAVGRASSFAGKVVEPFLKGSYTVSDENMYRLMAEFADRENIFIEPSSAAAFYGPISLFGTDAGQNYLTKTFTKSQLSNSTHILWATGGSMVPEDIMQSYYKKGKSLI